MNKSFYTIYLYLIVVLISITVPKLGRLVYEPFESTTTPTASDCAEECRRYPISKCMGFNFDYGASTDCELLQSVEGHAKVEQVII